MKRVIYGENDRVVDWVAQKIDESRFEGAIGIGLEEDGELIAGVVFNMYTGPSICMHVAAVPGKRWMTREYLWRCFAYPFVQLGCRRITDSEYRDWETDRKSTRLNSSHSAKSRMPSSA